MSASLTPAWFGTLPLFRPGGSQHVLIIDNQVLSYRLLDGRSDPLFTFLFEDPRLVLQIGGQTIDESLHSVAVDDSGMENDRRGRPVRVGPVRLRPGLPADKNQMMWERQGDLMMRGKLFLARAMLPAQRQDFARLWPLIEGACGRRVGAQDARVVADALVRRIPLLTLDARLRAGFAHGQADGALTGEIARQGLAGFLPRLFID
jgi:hypothetical protein